MVFAYSDVSHEYVMNRASLAMAAGADFRLLGPDSTMLEADRARGRGDGGPHGRRQEPDHAPSGGNSHGRGLKVVVVRHPMPYGNLEEQAVQRFAPSRT